MYLVLIILPLLGSIVSGFFGRKIGVQGSQILSCVAVIATTMLALVCFFQVGIKGMPISIEVIRWIDSESLNVGWAFYFDSLTVCMLIPVLVVSSLVHLYSIGYMSEDPHNQRFFSYLSLFTFMMVILVTGNNYLVMFVGWEGVGVCSYLLVCFWFTRIAANQSSLAAFITNRVGDCFLTIGMFYMLLLFGNLDYATIFSLSGYMNEQLITIIGICLLIGATAKSSQVGLHVWLPMAMEGPTPVSALIHAATMVTAGVYLLVRSSPLIEYSGSILTACLLLGAVTTVFSSLIGLFQQDIKKVIAYSTMSQLGMMVIAIGLSSYPIALYHLMNHAFYKALLFLGAGSVIHAVSDNQDFRKYGGLRAFLPLTYSVMLIASLSLVAFPFMTGFYSKDLILESAYGHYSFYSIAVYIIATIGALFTTLYSVKVLYLTFLTSPNGPLANYRKAHEGDIFMTLPLIILAVLSIFFGFIAKDIFIGMGSSFFSDNALFIHPSHEILIDTEFGVPTIFKLLPFVFTVLLTIVSVIMSEYKGSTLIDFKSSRIGYNIFGFFNQRFLIELFYNNFVTGIIFKLGGQTTKVLDKGFVEYLGPYGLEKGLINLSLSIASLSTGVITSYALYILTGLIFYLSISHYKISVIVILIINMSLCYFIDIPNRMRIDIKETNCYICIKSEVIPLYWFITIYSATLVPLCIYAIHFLGFSIINCVKNFALYLKAAVGFFFSTGLFIFVTINLKLSFITAIAVLILLFVFITGIFYIKKSLQDLVFSKIIYLGLIFMAIFISFNGLSLLSFEPLDNVYTVQHVLMLYLGILLTYLGIMTKDTKKGFFYYVKTVKEHLFLLMYMVRYNKKKSISILLFFVFVLVCLQLIFNIIGLSLVTKTWFSCFVSICSRITFVKLIFSLISLRSFTSLTEWYNAIRIRPFFIISLIPFSLIYYFVLLPIIFDFHSIILYKIHTTLKYSKEALYMFFVNCYNELCCASRCFLDILKSSKVFQYIVMVHNLDFLNGVYGSLKLTAFGLLALTGNLLCMLPTKANELGRFLISLSYFISGAELQRNIIYGFIPENKPVQLEIKKVTLEHQKFKFSSSQQPFIVRSYKAIGESTPLSENRFRPLTTLLGTVLYMHKNPEWIANNYNTYKFDTSKNNLPLSMLRCNKGVYCRLDIGDNRYFALFNDQKLLMNNHGYGNNYPNIMPDQDYYNFSPQGPSNNTFVVPDNDQDRDNYYVTPYQRQASFVPLNQQQSFVPINMEQSFVPSNMEQNFVPSNMEQSFVSFNQQQNFVPSNMEQTPLVPFSQQQSFVPSNMEQTSLVPFSQRQVEKQPVFIDLTNDISEFTRSNNRLLNQDQPLQRNRWRSIRSIVETNFHLDEGQFAYQQLLDSSKVLSVQRNVPNWSNWDASPWRYILDDIRLSELKDSPLFNETLLNPVFKPGLGADTNSTTDTENVILKELADNEFTFDYNDFEDDFVHRNHLYLKMRIIELKGSPYKDTPIIKLQIKANEYHWAEKFYSIYGEFLVSRKKDSDKVTILQACRAMRNKHMFVFTIRDTSIDSFLISERHVKFGQVDYAHICNAADRSLESSNKRIFVYNELIFQDEDIKQKLIIILKKDNGISIRENISIARLLEYLTEKYAPHLADKYPPRRK